MMFGLINWVFWVQIPKPFLSPCFEMAGPFSAVLVYWEHSWFSIFHIYTCSAIWLLQRIYLCLNKRFLFISRWSSFLLLSALALQSHTDVFLSWNQHFTTCLNKFFLRVCHINATILELRWKLNWLCLCSYWHFMTYLNPRILHCWVILMWRVRRSQGWCFWFHSEEN